MLLVTVYTDNNSSRYGTYTRTFGVSEFTDNNSLPHGTYTRRSFDSGFVDALSYMGNKIKTWASDTKEHIVQVFQKLFVGDSDEMLRYDDHNSSKILSNRFIPVYGYKVEPHNVETMDGYILKHFRVLPLHRDPIKRIKVALLLHGFMGSSDDWFIQGSKKALPYILVDIGYDVWLINFRGNRYSQVHSIKQINLEDFWDFSFHEMGIYDLPALIDHIIAKISGELEIHIIGYSMGTTAALAMLSTQARYNGLLNSSVLLAPLAYMHHIKGPFKVLAAFAASKGLDSLSFLDTGEFLSKWKFPPEIIEKHCRGDKDACKNPLLFLANGGKHIQDERVFKNVIGHVPAGTSTKTVKHYVQLINSGRFAMFDYGPRKNMALYGRKVPLSYRLNKIKLPLHLVASDDDWLATVPNVMNLYSRLPNSTLQIIRDKDFSHTDFIWGPHSPQFLFFVVAHNLRL